ncbi:uncharacterized protein LOC117640027 [Thrips palmi]|uniref:Uncharacterized protein LOC117640027 n=1 Tax=Thrips palmi TaxID=161013 RepID=A0A6P8ZHM3_THRPL|nr:uncharacterized protein LOC117640027 [Thrips palmi]XP_034232104.1 uncharacterized protein LOC117640027 [Thrips palmi]XP_034232105.1 uncharacterized protein LOC117640027 [Thrips palmi]
MTEQGPTIKVHCGSNLVFSCSKPAKDSESGGKTAALVSSLKEAQVRVNQFLTELVEKSGSSNSNKGGDDEASDEEDEEADEDSCGKLSEAMKRKLEGNELSSNTSKTDRKRTKTQT